MNLAFYPQTRLEKELTMTTRTKKRKFLSFPVSQSHITDLLTVQSCGPLLPLIVAVLEDSQAVHPCFRFAILLDGAYEDATANEAKKS